MKKTTILFIIISAQAHSTPIFSSYSDEETTGKKWSAPTNTQEVAIKRALTKETSLELVEFKKNNQDTSFKDLLSSTSIKPCKKCNPILFIRASSKNYSPFFGVHSFSFWLLNKKNEVIFTKYCDYFNLISQKANNIKIETLDCTANSCTVNRYLVSTENIIKPRLIECAIQQIDGENFNEKQMKCQ